jgi:hypothetical protein
MKGGMHPIISVWSVECSYRRIIVFERGYLPLSENAKVASGVVLHIDSYDLHGIGFFDKNELESLFYS